MSFMMGIMADFLVAGIISGQRHFMGGMTCAADKVEKSSKAGNHQAIVLIKGAFVIIDRPW